MSGQRVALPTRLSRRRLLQTGVGALGLSLTDFLSLRQHAAAADTKSLGSARSCIVLFCWGGMSHHETFDPKPRAPKEIRGLFNPISTAVPGIHVGEHIPLLAAQMDKLAVIRSVHHGSSAHGKGLYWNLTGHAPPKESTAENLAPSAKDWPSLLSMVSQFRDARRGVPRSVRLPYPMVDATLKAGEYGGWLGRSEDPIVIRTPGGTPYGGVSRTMGSAVLNLSEKIDHQRLIERDRLARSLERSPGTKDAYVSHDHFRELARDMLLAPNIKRAYNLELEDAKVRATYGDHICGRSVLLARRLTEVGVPIVTVCCAAGDLNGSKGDHWDTHADNFNRLKNTMLPTFDRAASALLADLHQRGSLDETLVVMLTDFGRTPKINGAAGRDHYPGVYSIFLAGGGIRGGQVYGSSDAHGAHPRTGICTPADVHATIFRAMGISPHAELRDKLDRPLAICDGKPLPLT